MQHSAKPKKRRYPSVEHATRIAKRPGLQNISNHSQWVGNDCHQPIGDCDANDEQIRSSQQRAIQGEGQ